MRWFRKLTGNRPTVEPQSEASDCGYVCISAVMALTGNPKSVDDVRQAVGTTSRGLTIKQVRDGLKKFDVKSDAIFFDKNRSEAFPSFGILLLDRGHFVVSTQKRGRQIEIFDPLIGWTWISIKRLKRSVTGFGIQIDEKIAHNWRSIRLPTLSRKLMKLTLDPSFLLKALGLFVCAEILALALPLLAMQSVDSSVAKGSLSFAGMIVVGFLALSTVNALTKIVGEVTHAKIKQKMYRRLGGVVFDALSVKSSDWYERSSGASIQNQIQSLQVQLDFLVDSLRTGTMLAISIVAGLGVLMFISPWLAIPGLISLALTTSLDLFLASRQRGLMSASVEANQRRQAFVFGSLVQMPLMVRHGSVRRCRAEYTKLMMRVGSAAGALQVLQGWRSTLGAFLKSAETIIFVTLSAWLMAKGQYTIGGFVALGAYKDLLAAALSSAFQLGIRHNSMAIHRLQAGKLLEDLTSQSVPQGMHVESGVLSVRHLSYRYGTLDQLAIDNISFDVVAGNCLMVRGISGSGKSTLAKLVAGVASPLHGRILIDGQPASFPAHGLAAVLQIDRLIAGSIRENIVLYRSDVSDADIWQALEVACIDEFVRELPMRLNSLVAEEMTGLSGGQRQRLLLARALVGKPKILILDEATSSLDVKTESKIMANLRALKTTMIVVSHRPEIWSFGDEVIEISDGKISLLESTFHDMLSA